MNSTACVWSEDGELEYLHAIFPRLHILPGETKIKGGESKGSGTASGPVLVLSHGRPKGEGKCPATKGVLHLEVAAGISYCQTAYYHLSWLGMGVVLQQQQQKQLHG